MNLAELSSPAVKKCAPHSVALLPLGATEQHGAHLTVSTDSAIVCSIAEAIEKALPRQVVLCPPFYFGSSHHHLGFPGTLSLSAEVYTRVVVDLVRSLLSSGFRRIVLLNGHGGNITPVQQALAMLSHEFDDTLRPNIALATYWELAGNSFNGAACMETPALSHACEYETSLMLHLHPRHVFKHASARRKRSSANRYIPWESEFSGRGVTQVKKTQFISNTGASGAAHQATPAKGKHLWRQAVSSSVAFLSDFATWPLMEDLRNAKDRNSAR